MRKRLQTIQTQLLLRGGPRTPKQALPTEAFWEATLPEDELLLHLSRAGQPRPDGPRRKRVPQRSGVWGAFTTRGADESYAAGRRVRVWLNSAALDASSQAPAEEDSELGKGSGSSALPPHPRDVSAQPIHVYCRKGSRHELTARAVLRGLCLQGQKGVIDTTLDGELQVLVPADIEEQCPWDDGNIMLKSVATELCSILRLNSPETLAEGGWRHLLDVAECASNFGLLPSGALHDHLWRTLRAAPTRVATYISEDESRIARTVGPLIRLVLADCAGAASEASMDAPAERLRVYILPGFSLLCLARAVGLQGAISWPAASDGLLLETLLDEHGEVFVRFWQPRDSWELRPSWHREPGPVPLVWLLQSLEVSMGGPLPWSADASARVHGVHGRPVA